LRLGGEKSQRHCICDRIQPLHLNISSLNWRIELMKFLLCILIGIEQCIQAVVIFLNLSNFFLLREWIAHGLRFYIQLLDLGSQFFDWIISPLKKTNPIVHHSKNLTTLTCILAEGGHNNIPFCNSCVTFYRRALGCSYSFSQMASTCCYRCSVCAANWD
jgi:hypothetical protein